MLGGIWLAARLAVSGADQGSWPYPRPEWIGTLPAEPGKIYALGTADLRGSEGEALRAASDRARLEVVARLRANVRGAIRVTTRSLETKGVDGGAQGAGNRQVFDEVRIETRAEDLPGLAVERTYTDPRAGTAYALASLDLVQAHATLAARLEGIRQRRRRLGPAWNWKVRSRLRGLKDDLDRLDGALDLLAAAGGGPDLRPALQDERARVTQRLAAGRTLPPMDLARMATGLRSNVELPEAVVSGLVSRITDCGLRYRNLDPDLTISLTFAGGSRGPAFIFAALDPEEGLNYHLEARMVILDDEGTPLTHSATLQVVQAETPEGMVDRFRRQFEIQLSKLVSEVQAQFQ